MNLDVEPPFRAHNPAMVTAPLTGSSEMVIDLQHPSTTAPTDHAHHGLSTTSHGTMLPINSNTQLFGMGTSDKVQRMDGDRLKSALRHLSTLLWLRGAEAGQPQDGLKHRLSVRQKVYGPGVDI